MISRNDKVTNLWKKFLIKCLYNIDKTRILNVHKSFFEKVFSLESNISDHVFDEKLTIARILGLSLDWRDMNFNSALRQFSFDVLKFKKLEEMKQEHQEELENLICACEVHELSYNSFFNEETFELLSNF